ncbi:MAG: winged helix-turn-helix transcriptional regulator [Spirochaetales bacterium]|nr:winged helix-turn-helix transcriptional regulator [Spirochaetales bacterium]
MLSEKQFMVMTCLEKERRVLTQREIASLTKISIGRVNTIVNQLAGMGFIKCGELTDSGLNALEPYRVKRAIIIAAGFSARLIPISLNTSVSMINIKGKPIIESLLSAIKNAGIKEIIIVRGYLGQQFEQLRTEYPEIKFIDNVQYNETHNISSLLCVRDLLENAYVCEADLLLNNQNLITKYQYCTNYLGVPVKQTDDWCFTVKNGYITKVHIGGKNCYHMFGISYWDAKDGVRLKEHIKAVYEMPGGKERFWDQVALEYFIKEYNVRVRECSFDDIKEIDTFNELKQLEPVYNI